ncbi:MAG: hypothetical protein ACKO2P_12225 [Planctomycetota bacterium]
MSVSLDPVVIRKLDQFARRRRLLLAARGLSACLLTFLLCLAAAACIDWYWLLTDTQRWQLSACVYIPALLAGWLVSGRQLLHAPASAEIAEHVEQSEPQLREKLLAAVDLAVDDPRGLHDSPAFRSLLQGEVAARMGRVQPSAVLPFRLAAKWVLAAAAMLVLALLPLSSSNPGFRQLALRAMLPMANLARVSRVQVRILQPSPPSQLLPRDESAAVIVETSGGTVTAAILETRAGSSGVVRTVMTAQSESRFSANLQLDSLHVDYRILAGDAITQWHRIRTSPRPRVEMFTKTLVFPEYSQLQSVTTTDTDGRLEALQGTQVTLAVQTNLAISAAELRLDEPGGNEGTVIPLQAAGTTWTGVVPIQEPGTYRVHLVAKETGFSNEFSPRYEIRPQPDLIPRVGFVDQQQSTLLLPPDDILQLRAMAEDDLPLVSLEQQISINGEDWISLPLETAEVAGTEGRGVTAEWQWDLVPHGLRPGDQVLTKLSAVDRRGSRGESAPLRLVIADREFDPQRHTQMRQKLGLQQELGRLAALLGEQKTTATEILDRLKALPPDAPQAISDRAALQDLADRQRTAVDAVLQRTHSLLRRLQPGADAADVERTGQILAKLAVDQPGTVSAALTAFVQAADDKQRQEDLAELKRGFESAAEDARVLAEHYSWLSSWNLFDAASFELQAMLQHQEFVVSSPTQTWRRLQRQQQLQLTQLENFERLLQEQRAALPEPLNAHINQLIDWSAASRDQLQQTLESEERLGQLQAFSKVLRDQLLQRQKLDVLDSAIPGRLQSAWTDLENRAGGLAGVIDGAAEQVRQEQSSAQQAATADDSGRSQQLASQAARFAARLDLWLVPSLQQLRSRQRLTEARPDADLQYAADAGLALRATEAVLYRHRSNDSPAEPEKVPEHLREIAPAWRTLEAGHHLFAALTVMARLQELERWNSRQRSARIDQPRHWDLLQQSLDVAVRRLTEARADNVVINRLNQTRWSAEARDAGRRISERRWRRDVLTATGHELDGMAAELTGAMQDLQPAMAAARAVLARFAPSITQLAKNAAAEVRKLEEQTLKAADAAEPQTPNSSQPEQPELAQLRQQQELANDRIDDLLQALVEDAARQDLTDEQQRERARDSDDSLALIQPPAERMNQELQQAAEASSEAAQQQELAQAAEQQEKTAQALETVARHFEAMEQQAEIAETRAALRAAEQDRALPPQVAEQYQLASAAEQQMERSAQQQLEELEAELQRNPEMQQALSEIARNSLADAESLLKDAAAEDQNLQQANERADAGFQERKRDLAEDLRQIGTQASQLSGMLVAQAAQAAAQGKTPEAQSKLAETQQKLNAAAAQASSAREEQLLAELQQTAAGAKQALQEASALLNEGRNQSATAKDQPAFPDAAARDAQQKNSEKQRQAFREQQKKTANDQLRQTEEAAKRTQQAVKNAENELQAADRRVEQAQQHLNKKPTDAGLQQQVSAQQQQRQTVQQKLDSAKRQQDRAAARVQAAQQKRDAANNAPQPPLNAPNPAAQLAEHYAGEAAESLKNLQQQTESLQADFGNTLTTPQNQLAAAEQRQQELTEDVATAAADVARAARHEKRLNNPAAASALEQAARMISQAATGESAAAEQQLQEAVAEAAQQATQPQNPPANAQTLEAQQRIEAAENAFKAGAEQVAQTLNPLQQAAAAEAAAQAEAAIAGNENSAAQPAGEPTPGQQTPGQPTPSQPTPGQPAAAPQAGTPQAPGQPTPSQPAGAQQSAGEQAGQATQPDQSGQAPQPGQATVTAEQQLAAQQLAQALDELDRQLAAAASSEAQPANPSSGQQPTAAQATGVQTPLSQSQNAQALQARMAAARRQAQQQARQALAQSTAQSADGFSEPPEAQPFEVSRVNRLENANWGRLRGQAAEDVSRGRGEQIPEAWRGSVETYFRVLSERARKQP